MHKSEEKISTAPLWSRRAVRLQIVLLLSLGIAMQAIFRGSFGMALVCFVDDPHALQAVSNASESLLEIADDSCKAETLQEAVADNAKISTGIVSEYTVPWSMEEVSRIHTAFFVGSFATVFIVDKSIRRFGPKRVALMGTLLAMGGALLTPLAIILVPTPFAVMAVRFIMGIGYCLFMPCGNTLISCWFPAQERSTAVAVFTTGNQIGMAFAMLMTSRICEIRWAGGWPLAFVIYALIAFFFVSLWTWRVVDKPRDHSSVSAEELEHITGHSVKLARALSAVHAIPYKKILCSLVILSLGISAFGQTFVVIGIDTNLPKYYQTALKMNLSSNGFFSASPFIVQVVTKLTFAVFADYLKSRKISLNLIMKTFNGIAAFGSAICIFLISFMGCGDSVAVMILMGACLGLFSGFVPGYNTCIVTVAPLHTPSISAYCQIYVQFASMLVPIIVGVLTPNGSVAEWRSVFYMLSGVLVVTGVFFQIFGTAHALPWGDAHRGKGSSRKDIDEENEVVVPLTVLETA